MQISGDKPAHLPSDYPNTSVTHFLLTIANKTSDGGIHKQQYIYDNNMSLAWKRSKTGTYEWGEWVKVNSNLSYNLFEKLSKKECRPIEEYWKEENELYARGRMGTPEEVAKVEKSYTGQYLKKYL